VEVVVLRKTHKVLVDHQVLLVMQVVQVVDQTIHQPRVVLEQIFLDQTNKVSQVEIVPLPKVVVEAVVVPVVLVEIVMAHQEVKVALEDK
tara:strand:- start:104 stop:373 length:270 start_codon:yes stop_codon:yes gene_type:complete